MFSPFPDRFYKKKLCLLKLSGRLSKNQSSSSFLPSSAKINPVVVMKLSLMINYFCVAHALLLSIPESPLFKNVLIRVHNTNNTYKPPSWYEMSGDLLKANYVVYQCDQLNKLLMNVESFGIGIFVNGRTIVKVSMMNILACLAGNFSCVLDVVNCIIMLWKATRKMPFLIASRCCLACNRLIQRIFCLIL